MSIVKNSISREENKCLFRAFSFGFSLRVFKTHMLLRGFHPFIKGVSLSSLTDVDFTIHPLRGPASSLALGPDISFFSPTDVGSYNPPLLVPASSPTHVPYSNRCGTPPIHPPSGPNVLTGTLPHVHPLRGSAYSGILFETPPIHPPYGPSVLAGTIASCPSPSGLSLSTDTLPGVWL